MRIQNEASLFENNCFITLTYNDEHIPLNGGLNKRDFQLFMKRLRKAATAKRPNSISTDNADGTIRYFHCGEYGENTGRPHYHACLFGIAFTDLVAIQSSRQHTLYQSQTLDDIWKKGHTTVGALTFESAAYTARYVVKKLTGKQADEYESIDAHTGEMETIEPPYATMSRRPGGIGKAWYDKYKTDAYPSDTMVMRGKEMKPPKYYDRILEQEDPTLYKQIKAERQRAAKAQTDRDKSEELHAAQTITTSRVNQTSRNL